MKTRKEQKIYLTKAYNVCLVMFQFWEYTA